MKEKNPLIEIRKQVIGYREHRQDVYTSVEPVYETQYRTRLCETDLNGQLRVSAEWSDWMSVEVDTASAHDHSRAILEAWAGLSQSK